jgi:hypothetical protein
MLVWQQLHGVVSLRISRPLFPWPPLAETFTDADDRLLAGAHADADDHHPETALLGDPAVGRGAAADSPACRSSRREKCRQCVIA